MKNPNNSKIPKGKKVLRRAGKFMTKTRRRKLLSIVLVALMLLSSVRIWQFINPAETAAWWDDSYSYRQRIPISNSGSAQTDFQIKLSLDTAALITAGKMQADCDDIRLTDQGGNILPYWIEENDPGCNDAATDIWVNVPSIPTSGAAVYIYYGNSSVSVYSNGENTFEFFDTFAGSSLDTGKWAEFGTSYGTNSVSSGELTVSNTSGGSTESLGVYSNTTPVTTGYAVYARSKNTVGRHSQVVGFSDDPFRPYPHGDSTTDGVAIYSRADNTSSACSTANGANDEYEEIAQDLTSYGINNIEFISSSSVKGYTGDSLRCTFTTTANIPSGNFPVSFSNDGYSETTTSVIDWVFVKKTDATEPTVGSLGSEEVGPGPIAYWKFDEGSDNTCSGGTNDACDSTINGNDGAKTGATWQTEDMCISGNCLSFNGADDYVNVGSDSSLNLLNGFTISAWIRNNSLTGIDNIIAESGANDGYGFSTNGTDLRFTTFGIKDYAPSNITLTTGAWYHVAVVFDSSNDANFYINGEFIETVSGTSPADTADQDYWIGGNTSGSPERFDGFIDELKIYPYERSAAQIKTDYIKGAGASGSSAVLGAKNQTFLSDGLVGYWKMDEATENTCTGGTNDSCDSSGNGIDGYWANDATSATGKYGNGVTFDNDTDYVLVPDHDALDMEPNQDMSFAMWVKTANADSSASLLEKGATSGSDDPGFWILMWDGQIDPRLGNTSGNRITAIGVKTINDNEWHHVVVVYDRDDKTTIYIDGAYDASRDISSLAAVDNGTGDNLDVGGRSNGTYTLDGEMDEVRAYNRALSSGEVKSLYQWAPGPVGYWPMDENTGTSTYDKSTNGHDSSSFNGTPSWTQGKYGSSLDFEDTENDWVVVSDHNDLDMATNDYTVCLWINPETTGNQYDSPLDHREDSGTNLGYQFRWGASNEMEFISDYGASSVVSAGSALSTGTWYYYCAVVDRSGSQYLYHNGQLADSDDISSYSATDISHTDDFLIGSMGSTTYDFDGLIDEVKIYNYARTPSQIIEDMNAGHPIGGSPVGSPIVHYKFDEGHGTVANDSSLNSYNGTINGTATWEPNGKVGRALDFDGSTGYVRIDDTPITFSSRNRTISYWVKPTSADLTGAHNVVTGYDTSYTYSRLRSMFSGGNIYFAFYVYPGPTTVTMTSTSTIVADQWYHVIVTWDDDEYKLYVNGIEEDSYSHSGVTADTVNIITIGSNQDSGDPANYLNGEVDEFKIYNAALTEEQIKVDMNAGAATNFGTGTNEAANLSDGAGDPPVGYWPMDENTGISTTFDKSGNGNDGALTSITESSWVPGKFGSALDLGDSGEYALVSDDSTLQLTTIGTVQAWIYPRSLASDNWDVVVNKGSWGAGRNDYSIYYHQDGANIRFEVDGATTTQYVYMSNSNTPLNTWTHVAMTWTGVGSPILVYINGVQTAGTTTGNLTEVPDTSGYDLEIAMSGRPFDGLTDEVKIYDYARTQAQIAYDYNRGKPVGWWRFDECQGTTANDASGKGNNGTITEGGSGDNDGGVGTCSSGDGAEMWDNGTTGKFNASLDFDGTDDKITISDPSDDTLDFGTSDFSVSSWIWVDSTQSSSFPTIFHKGGWGGTTETGYNMYYDDIAGNLRFRTKYAALGSEYSSLYSLTSNNLLDQWIHVASTVDRDGNQVMFVNGNQVDSDSISVQSAVDISNSKDIYLGVMNGNSYYFNGQIDDMRVYNYALSAKQIRNVMNGGAVRFE